MCVCVCVYIYMGDEDWVLFPKFLLKAHFALVLPCQQQTLDVNDTRGPKKEIGDLAVLLTWPTYVKCHTRIGKF